MADILFDASIYISALRKGDPSILMLRRAARSGDNTTQPLWLSAVVLEELYAGAGDTRTRKVFLRLEREFEKLNRLLVPHQGDWSLTGQVLAQIGAKYGFEEDRAAAPNQ
jgi:predicted nucleic acid-binding protein